MESDIELKAATLRVDEIQLPAIPTCDTEIAPSFPGETGDNAVVDPYAKAVSRVFVVWTRLPGGLTIPDTLTQPKNSSALTPRLTCLGGRPALDGPFMGTPLAWGNSDALWNYPEYRLGRCGYNSRPIESDSGRDRIGLTEPITNTEIGSLSRPPHLQIAPRENYR